MENYQLHDQHIVNEQQQRTYQNQIENIFTQSFVCDCERSFKTMELLRQHIMKQHSNDYQPVNRNEKKPMVLPHKFNNEQFNQRVPLFNYQDMPLNRQIQNQQLTKFKIKNLNQTNLQQQYFDQKKSNQPMQTQHQYHGNSQNSNESKNIVSRDKIFRTAEQKENFFKYFQNYYKQKMKPFYQQFDIQPYKNNKQKNTYEHNNNKQPHKTDNPRQQLTPANLPKLSQYSISTTLQDFSSIQQQLYIRMIPISNGILQFIQSIQHQNLQNIKNISIEYKDMVSKILQDKFYHLITLNRLNEERLLNNVQGFQNDNRKNDRKNDDFMNSDLVFALMEFVSFIAKTVKISKIWIVESMVIIVTDVIMETITSASQNKMGFTSLKVHQIYSLLTKICQYANNHPNISQLQIPSSNITRLMIWICQWVTIKQYMFNKFNVDYVDDLLTQIHQVNGLYRQNVQLYNECSKKRKLEIQKKYKQKVIEEKQKYMGNGNRSYYQGNYFCLNNNNNQEQGQRENDFRRQGFQQSKYYNDIYRKNWEKNNEASENKLFSLNSNINIENQIKDRQQLPINNIFSGLSNKKKQKQTTGTEQQSRNIVGNSQFYKSYFNPIAQHLERQTLANQKQYAQYPFTSKNPFMSNQYPGLYQRPSFNQRQSQLHQKNTIFNSVPLPPMHQSQYVNYFAEQNIQARKKLKQAWKIRVQQLTAITKNPQIFKSKMKQAINKQMEQFQQFYRNRQIQAKQMQAFLNRRDISLTHNQFKQFRQYIQNNQYDSYGEELQDLQIIQKNNSHSNKQHQIQLQRRYYPSRYNLTQKQQQINRNSNNFSKNDRDQYLNQNDRQQSENSVNDPFIIKKNFRKRRFVKVVDNHINNYNTKGYATSNINKKESGSSYEKGRQLKPQRQLRFYKQMELAQKDFYSMHENALKINLV